MVGAPKLLVFFPKKEQMEKSEMKEQEESRGRECKKIVWHTVGLQFMPLSFPGREQKEAQDSRDHRDRRARRG